DVDDARLVLNDRSRHTVHRFMGCPLGTVPKRPRLEVRLEDWLQYQLERALHHSVADSRNRKDADLAPILRNFLSPGRQRHIATPDQFVRDLPEERLYALRFDGLEGHPVSMGVSSRRLQDMAVERPHFIASLATVFKEGIIPVPGGVLILDEAGAVIGTAGASGDTSDNDE